MGRIAAKYGAAYASKEQIKYTFPTPDQVKKISPNGIGMPTKRAMAIALLAQAVLNNSVKLSSHIAPNVLASELKAIPGIGPWTSNYVLMRGLASTDIFMASDLAVRRVVKKLYQIDSVIASLSLIHI